LKREKKMKFIHKRSILLISSIVLFASSCSSSPTSTPTIPTLPIVTLPPAVTVTPIPTRVGDLSQLQPDLAYGILLEQVKQADPNFDFTELRWTFAQTASYDPYNLDNDDLENSMYDAYDNQDYESALQLAKQMLEINYLLPDPHFIALRAYQELGDTKNADFHNYFLTGLITSILESGNGRSLEGAFIVILLEEEYFMLDIMGIQNEEQVFIDENGIPYDIFEGVDGETGNPVTVYFDISIPYHWLNESIPQ